MGHYSPAARALVIPSWHYGEAFMRPCRFYGLS